MLTQENLQDMAFHTTYSVVQSDNETITVMRVPNGWIYTISRLPTPSTMGPEYKYSVFVPEHV